MSKGPRVEKPYPHRPEPPMNEAVNRKINELLTELHDHFCDPACREDRAEEIHGGEDVLHDMWQDIEKKFQRLVNFVRNGE